MLCDQRKSPHTKITNTFNISYSENQFGFEVDDLFWAGKKVLGSNFFKPQEYSDFIVCLRGDISSTRKPA